MRVFAFALTILIGCSACRVEHHPHHEEFQAEINFSNSDIGRVELLMKKTADDWGLDYFEKDREEMALLNEGEPTFYISLRLEKDSILLLTNVLVPNQLILATTDYGKHSLTHLEQLVSSVQNALESEFAIAFKDVSKSGAGVRVREDQTYREPDGREN